MSKNNIFIKIRKSIFYKITFYLSLVINGIASALLLLAVFLFFISIIVGSYYSKGTYMDIGIPNEFEYYGTFVSKPTIKFLSIDKENETVDYEISFIFSNIDKIKIYKEFYSNQHEGVYTSISKDSIELLPVLNKYDDYIYEIESSSNANIKIKVTQGLFIDNYNDVTSFTINNPDNKYNIELSDKLKYEEDSSSIIRTNDSDNKYISRFRRIKIFRNIDTYLFITFIYDTIAIPFIIIVFIGYLIQKKKQKETSKKSRNDIIV